MNKVSCYNFLRFHERCPCLIDNIMRPNPSSTSANTYFTSPSEHFWDTLFFPAQLRKKKNSVSNNKITDTWLKLRLMSLQSNTSPAVNSPFILLAAVWSELAAQIRSSASLLSTYGASVLDSPAMLNSDMWLFVRLKSVCTMRPARHLVISEVLTPGQSALNSCRPCCNFNFGVARRSCITSCFHLSGQVTPEV